MSSYCETLPDGELCDNNVSVPALLGGTESAVQSRDGESVVPVDDGIISGGMGTGVGSVGSSGEKRVVTLPWVMGGAPGYEFPGRPLKTIPPKQFTMMDYHTRLPDEISVGDSYVARISASVVSFWMGYFRAESYFAPVPPAYEQNDLTMFMFLGWKNGVHGRNLDPDNNFLVPGNPYYRLTVYEFVLGDVYVDPSTGENRPRGCFWRRSDSPRMTDWEVRNEIGQRLNMVIEICDKAVDYIRQAIAFTNAKFPGTYADDQFPKVILVEELLMVPDGKGAPTGTVYSRPLTEVIGRLDHPSDSEMMVPVVGKVNITYGPDADKYL